MHLGKVIGSLVSTVKDENLEGVKLLIIQPLTHDLKPKGEPVVAVDSLQAGVGDIVYWIVGREASMALEKPFTPVDAAIVGIVDSVDE